MSCDGQNRTMNRVVRLAVPVSLCLLGVACALAATEWIVHRFYARLAPPSGDAAVQILLGNRTPDEALAIRLHPYMLYQNNPQFVRFGILALGGSTTYGYLLRDASDAWPAQLARILTERLGRPVEVVNGGLPYAMSSDLLAHYIFQDRFLGARIVLFHEGGNDAVPLLAENYDPDYGFFRKWASPSFGRRPGETTLLRSWTARLMYAHWLSGMDVGEFLSQPDAIGSMSPKRAREMVMRNQPIGFERNVTALVRYIRDDGAIPILFPFYLAERDALKTAAPGDYWKTHYDALATGYEKNVRVLQKIAATENVMYFRIPPGSIPLNLFFDHCHLRKAGETLKATFVADRIEGLVRRLADENDASRDGDERQASGSGRPTCSNR
ncbi:MAG: hypothetical protein DMF86_06935 [Acidobacteria bacterium]|nr:MAG: hypothetical protein DMF86_06935 [Acidobacteriota bacterium]